MARNADIEKKLLARPHDAVTWAMYGDWLAAAGDVRGELVGLMLAREARPSVELLQAERAFIEQHADVLLGPLLGEPSDERPLAWYRGFLRAATLESPDALAEALSHPSGAFIEHVTLLPEADDWPAWVEQLGDAPAPWRWVQLELEDTPEEPLELDALLLKAPRVEELGVSFRYDGAVDLGAATAPVLRLLTLENVGEVPALNVEQFPVLSELRLTREAAVEGSCQPKIVQWDDSDQDWLETAFAVIDASVSPDELRALIETVSGIGRLTACFGSLSAGSHTLTAIRFHGEGDAQLFPWAAAQALKRKHRRKVVASFAVSAGGGVARASVTGSAAAPTSVPSSQGGKLVRDVLDELLGFDPGPSTLSQLVDALRGTPIALVGAPLESYELDETLLSEIDAQSGPMVAPIDDEFGDGPANTDLFAALEQTESWEASGGPESGVSPDAIPPGQLEVTVAAVEEELPPEAEAEDEEEVIEDGLPPEDVVWAEGPVDPDEDWEVLPGEDPLLAEVVRSDPAELEAAPMCSHCLGPLGPRSCTVCGNDCCDQCSRVRARGGLEEITCQSCLNT